MIGGVLRRRRAREEAQKLERETEEKRLRDKQLRREGGKIEIRSLSAFVADLNAADDDGDTSRDVSND